MVLILNFLKLLPKEAVDIFEPLCDKVVRDGLSVVRKAQVLQSVEQKRGAVVKSSDGHLQTHGPQLTGLHLPRQTLQCSSNKQRDNLQQQIIFNKAILFVTYITTDIRINRLNIKSVYS